MSPTFKTITIIDEDKNTRYNHCLVFHERFKADAHALNSVID